jgi:hypothetical protein
MDAVTSDRVRAAFARISEAAGVDRASLVAALDADIREEVRSLLDSLDLAGGFMALPEPRST